MREGWEERNLGEICEILDSKRKPITKKYRIPGKYPYYGATGILDYVDNYIFDERLVLIGEDGAKWGAGEYTAFIVNGKYWVNNHAHVIRPNRDIIVDNWIVYFFYFDDLSKYVTGLTVPKLNQKNLKDIKIPIPPLSEQKRIVSILDKAFDSIEKAKINAEKNLINSKEVFESYLNNVFTNKGEEWEEKKLEEVCSNIFAGGDIPKNNFSKEKTGEYQIPIYTNGEKDKGLYGFTSIARVNLKSITVSARGTIGYTAIREEPFYPAVRLIVITPQESVINLYFLKYALEKNIFKSSGTSIPQLTVPMIKQIRILIPPLSEQKQIISKLDSLSQATQNLEKIYQKKINSLEEMKKSFLNKAFNGEL